MTSLFFIFILSSFFWTGPVLCETKASLSQAQIKALRVELKKRPHLAISPSDNRWMRIQRWMNSENKNDILKAIPPLKEKTRSSLSSEKAQAHLFLGQVFLKVQDYEKSISAFEESLKWAPYNRYLRVLLTLAQIHISKENFKKAEERMNEWQALSDRKKPGAHVLKASIHYSKKNHEKALSEILQAVSLSKKPSKMWLDMAVSLSIRLDKKVQAKQLLQQLVALYPSSSRHWRQLSGLEFKSHFPSSLAYLQLAHKAKAFKEESHFKQLISLLSSGGIPYPAAQILKKSIEDGLMKGSQKNYELLGDLWMQSRETNRALSAYKTSAEKKSQSPDILIKLGGVYYSLRNFKEAVLNMEKGLKRGESERVNKEDVYMKIGLSHYRLKNYEKAIAAFRKAEELQGRQEIPAMQWIRQAQKFLE